MGPVLTGPWAHVGGLAAASILATVSSPAGVSGAVLLPRFQVGVPAPEPVGHTDNLLYNVVATPGTLYRYRRVRAGAPASSAGFRLDQVLGRI